MFNWLMEDPVWILVVGLLATGIAGFVWTRTQHFGWLAASVVAFLLTLGLVALERFIKTDREKLRQTVSEMAQAVEDNDVEKLVTYIASDVPDCERRIRGELPTYTFKRCNVAQYNALVFDDPQAPHRAMAVFFVLADVNAPRYSYNGFVRRRVALFFEKQEDGQWLMYDYDHADPQQQFPYLPQNGSPPKFVEGPGNFQRKPTNQGVGR